MAETIDWLNLDPTDALSKKNDLKNCPNCGAPIGSERCPYCGTVFVDFASMDADKPFFLKIKQDDNVYIFKVMMTSTSIHSEPVSFYDDNRCLYTQGTTELSIDFVVVN